MKTMKFRAIIPERNATIYFDLNDLARLSDLNDIPRLHEKFSTREILVPWLLKGNVPDLYTGQKDEKGKEIYGGDILVPFPNEYNEPPYTVEFSVGAFTLTRPHAIVKTFWEFGNQWKVIGNVTENPELLEEK